MERNVYGSIPTEDILISNEGDRLLYNISKWTKFLSILGFIVLGMMALFVISAGVLISGMNEYAINMDMYPYTPGTFSWFYAVIYLIALAVYFIPVYYLYKFSVKTRQTLSDRSSFTLTEALNFLNKHYVFIGVLTIIGIIFFIISTIIMMFSMGSMV